jgi:hypothetical protein
MKTRASSIMVKWPGRTLYHSHPPRAKLKNQWSCTFTTPVYFYGTYWDFILPPTSVHISQEVTSFLVL